MSNNKNTDFSGPWEPSADDLAKYESNAALEKIMNRVERDRELEDADNLAADFRDQQEFVDEATVGLADDEWEEEFIMRSPEDLEDEAIAAAEFHGGIDRGYRSYAWAMEARAHNEQVQLEEGDEEDWRDDDFAAQEAEALEPPPEEDTSDDPTEVIRICTGYGRSRPRN